ncbi:MAG: PEP-CTERM sorting domain-containing protein [Rhodospirillales bacterium]|nr:PEP-CTERM sorting domain-containing protein [Acetobacter sp.]
MKVSATINADYLTGESDPFFITSQVPEPGTWACAALGLAVAAACRRRTARLL